MAAKELDDRNTTIVKSWVADIEADLAKAFPKLATKTSTAVMDAEEQRTPRGPGVGKCAGLFIAILASLPEDQHNEARDNWSANRIACQIKEAFKLDRAPTARLSSEC